MPKEPTTSSEQSLIDEWLAKGNEITKPSGFDVLPGTYSVKLTYNEASHSQKINVFKDARVELDGIALNDKQDFIAQYYELVTRVTEAVDKIDNASKVVVNVLAVASDNDVVKTQSNEIKKQLTGLREKIFEKQVQGFRNDPAMISSQLGNIRRTMGGSYKPITQSQTYAYNKAKKNSDRVISEINAFFTNEWVDYKALIDGANLELVKKF